MAATEYQRWVCDACGYIYDEAAGDPDSGLAPGTRYQDIPEDWMCPLCGLSKSDLRLLPEAPPAPVVARKPASAQGKCRGGEDYVVIVGAGVAGWSVAEAIRERDAQVPVLLVTACEGVSYPKPALSTAFAHGKQPDDLIELDALSHAEQLGIEVRTLTRVLKVDATKHRLTTAKGGISYGKLVLALGGQQRELALEGNAVDRVIRVNDLAAYRKLRSQLAEQVSHVTILGAGLIGTEFAEDLTSGGFKVSVIDPSPYPLASLLPKDVGNALAAKLSDKGVDWHFKVTAEQVDALPKGLQVTLSNGHVLETDLVISAAGLQPHTALADKSGIAVERGVIADSFMQTSAKDVFVLGDCAQVNGQIYAYIEPIRRQAKTIAARLAGESLPFESRPPLIRVKTPSYPLSVCLKVGLDELPAEVPSGESGSHQYERDGEVMGFVLSGEQAGQGSRLYQQMCLPNS